MRLGLGLANLGPSAQQAQRGRRALYLPYISPTSPPPDLCTHVSRLSVGVGPVNAKIAEIRKHLGTLRQRHISILGLGLRLGLGLANPNPNPNQASPELRAKPPRHTRSASAAPGHPTDETRHVHIPSPRVRTACTAEESAAEESAAFPPGAAEEAAAGGESAGSGRTLAAKRSAQL